MQQFVSTFGDTPEGFRPFRGTFRPFRPFARRKTFKKNKRKENHIGYINLKIIKQLNYQTQIFSVCFRTESITTLEFLKIVVQPLLIFEVFSRDYTLIWRGMFVNPDQIHWANLVSAPPWFWGKFLPVFQFSQKPHGIVKSLIYHMKDVRSDHLILLEQRA